MISFKPKLGMVLMCDFRGMVAPEMMKVRHVVVVSPRRRRSFKTCLVVPFSTVMPAPVELYHYKIAADSYSFFRSGTDVWAKADMVTHVSFERLDRVMDGGQYCSPVLSEVDVEGIRTAVWHALGGYIPADLSNFAKGVDANLE